MLGAFDLAKAHTFLDGILQHPTNPDEVAVARLFFSRTGTLDMKDSNASQVRESLAHSLGSQLSSEVFDTEDRGRGAVRTLIFGRLSLGDGKTSKSALKATTIGSHATIAPNAPPPTPSMTRAKPSVKTNVEPATPVRIDPVAPTASPNGHLRFVQSDRTRKDIVRLFHASINDDHPERIIVRGDIDPESIGNILVDTYQRNILASPKQRKKMLEGLRSGDVFPELQLGARGDEISVRQMENKGLVLEMLSHVFVVDGLQRLSAAKQHVLEGGEPLLDAKVVMNSTRADEKERFAVLNSNRTPVGPSVLLRNSTDDSRGMRILYELSMSDKFPLADRVSWEQARSPKEIMTAAAFLRSICWLHSRIDSSRVGNAPAITEIIDRIYQSVGGEELRRNALSFHEFFDQTWGVRNLQPKQRPVHVLAGFQSSMARMFGERDELWKGNTFSVPHTVVEKFKSFPLDDDFVRQAGSYGSKPVPDLVQHMHKHLEE